MGDTKEYQPLTRADKVSVVVYRAGIVGSTLTVTIGAVLWLFPQATLSAELVAPVALVALYASVGASVFFIHLYMGAYKKNLKIGYAVAIACLIPLYLMSNGNLPAAFASRAAIALFMLPLAGCLGFITAKEGFCFKLLEGYVLALLMPAYVLIVATGLLESRGAAYGLAAIAALLVLFTLRKVFMPLHNDIGDKTAYA